MPPPPQTRPIALVGGTIHPVSAPAIEAGQIVMSGGKIVAVGKNLSLPPNAEVIDITGKHVYPGLMAAHSELGLVEIGSVRASTDTAESGLINPNVRAAVSINPDSELLPVARTGGVLTALSVPQPGGEDGLITGTSALIQLDGWSWEEMALKPRVGLHIFWPTLAINRDPSFPKSPKKQQEEAQKRLRQIDDTFAVARAYRLARLHNSAAQDHDSRWEAMIPVFEGKLPVFIHADELSQIESALAWSAGQKLSIVLVGGQDAWRVAGRLKERDIPVIISPLIALPLRRDDPYDAPYTSAAKLFQAGVRFAIANDGSSFAAPHERNLPYQAAMAAAYGLPPDEAIRAITLYPAQILGVADRLGSLEVGKDATLIVTTGDPLEMATQTERAYIQGRNIDLANRQTRLYDKYRQKYERLLRTATPASSTGGRQ